MGMPMIVGAIADSFMFNDQQLGWVASADLGGMCIVSVIVSRLIAWINRRYLALAGILIAVMANIAAMQTDTLSTLLLSRIISGMGGGICYSVGLANLSATNNSTRSFSILMFALVSVNALELYTFPHVTNIWGVNGVYALFSLCFLLSFAIVPYIPHYAPANVRPTIKTEQKTRQQFSFSTLIPWICLAAVFSFYITIGSFWAYIERIAVNAQLADDYIVNALSVVTLLTLVGCFFSRSIGQRFGHILPLLFVLSMLVGVLVYLSLSISYVSFAVGVLLFNYCWLYTDIFQLSTLSDIDKTGRYSALVPTAQGVAQTLGPLIAGALLIQGAGYRYVLLLGASSALIALLLYLIIFYKMRVAQHIQ